MILQLYNIEMFSTYNIATLALGNWKLNRGVVRSEYVCDERRARAEESAMGNGVVGTGRLSDWR
jgi:hypothetical protein